METMEIAAAIELFTKAGRPFSGKLIAPPSTPPGECRYCAQGLILNACGTSDDELRQMEQWKADKRVAERLGISLTESVLLRNINDGGPGLPQAVLILTDEGIGSIIGSEWRKIVSFWRYLDTITQSSFWRYRDTLTQGDWGKMTAAGFAAGDAAREAALTAAGYTDMAAAREAIRSAAWTGGAAWAADGAARDAVGATTEIQGASKLESFFFLPLFGFKTPADIPDFEK